MLNPKQKTMLQSKDINKIAELKNGFTPRWLEPDFILSSLTCFSFSALCKHLNPFKQRGYSFESVFSCLISLPFLGLNTVHSFTASAMSEHIKAKKEYKKQHRKNREKGTHSWDSAREADTSKIESALRMFWRAISQGIKVDYLLMDSWFTCEAFIKAVQEVETPL
jgi:hypothetical protein